EHRRFPSREALFSSRSSPLLELDNKSIHGKRNWRIRGKIIWKLIITSTGENKRRCAFGGQSFGRENGGAFPCFHSGPGSARQRGPRHRPYPGYHTRR